MAIEYPIKKSLGVDVHNFPKVQYDKIAEIIDAVNDLTDGTINTTNLALAGSLTVATTAAIAGNETVGGTLAVTGATTLSSTLSAGASTLASSTVTGASTVGTTLAVTGVTTLTGGVAVASESSTATNTPTINKPSGRIISATLTTAALGNEAIVLTNSFITASSKVFVNISGYSGQATPLLLQAGPSAGSVSIRIYNAHATLPLNAAITLDFLVVN